MSGEPRLVRTFESVDSTNERALALAAAGAPDGSIVSAAEQTAGRGRRGRSWHSPGGGLYLSYIVRAVDALPQPALLTLAAGVAVVEAIRDATGLTPALKWPNDIVIGEPPRKLAGILTEASGVGSRLEYAVIGIGINVSTAAFPPDLATLATSLGLELGREIDRKRVQDALVVALDRGVARLREGREADLLAAWTAAAPGARGRRVAWLAGDETRQGVTDGIDATGALLVRRADGTVERLVAGDVTWA